MKKIIFNILILLSLSSFSQEKLAMIDTGINLDKVDKNKIYFSDYLNCYYNFNIEDRIPCLKNDIVPEEHGTIVFKILSKNVTNNSILSYIYATPDKSLKNILAKMHPMSLKDVYEKKQLFKINSEYIADAIELAINNNATVINISIADRGLYSKKLEDVIKNNPQILFVFAAGNNSDNMDIEYHKNYPCSIKSQNTLCVGALNKNKKAEYSNFGKDVDIFIQPKLDEGTSFSAPIIANEAFLLKTNKKYSVNRIIKFLKHKYKN